MKTPTDLIKIAAASGGLILDSAKYTPTDLVRIAAAANGGQIVLRNADSKTPTDLVKIAVAGRGAILFDLTD